MELAGHCNGFYAYPFKGSLDDVRLYGRALTPAEILADMATPVGNGGPARLLRNDYKGGNRWVRLHLKGDGVRANRSAIGAQVTIEAGGKKMQREITAGRGYLSQSELPLTVGLGSATKVDRVTVRWPCRDHHEETWKNLDAGQLHELVQGTAPK